MARLSLEAKIMKKDDLRGSVETAINAYNFLEAVDTNSPLLIRAGLTEQTEQTMVDCVIIIKDCIKELRKI
jgi:hypothetical protein